MQFLDVPATLVFLFLPSLPCLAFLRTSNALLAGPVVSAVIASFSAVIITWIPIPIALAWSAICLSVIGLVLWTSELRANIAINARQRIGNFDFVCLVLTGLVLLILCSRVPAPLAWDARSIWLFHASWFSSPIQDLQAAFSQASLEFSHPDYPPLGPASIAVLWQMAARDEHLRMGITLLTALPVFVTSLAISRLNLTIRSACSVRPRTTFLFVLFPICASLAGGLIDKGYMDVVQAVSILLVTALLLERMVIGASRESSCLIVVACLFASLSKQEGLWFVCIGLVSLVLADRTHWRLAMISMLVVFVPFLTWRYTVGHFGYSAGSDASGLLSNMGELLSPGSKGLTNIRSIVGRYSPDVLLPMTSLLIVGILVFLRSHVSLRPRRVAVFLLLTWSGQISMILLTYALGRTRESLDWWLNTSFTRVVATPWAHIGLVLCVAVVMSRSTFELRRAEHN